MRFSAFSLFIATLGLLLSGCGPVREISSQPSKTASIILQNTPTFLQTDTAQPTRTVAVTIQTMQSPTSATVPVSDEIKLLFDDLLNVQAQDWNVCLQLLDLFYERNLDNSLALRVAIRCLSSSSPCKTWMYSYSFLIVFADPEPQPEKMALFPAQLAEFKVYGYDENLNLIDSFAGKWSDLVEYEKNMIPEDELERRLYEP